MSFHVLASNDRPCSSTTVIPEAPPPAPSAPPPPPPVPGFLEPSRNRSVTRCRPSSSVISGGRFTTVSFSSTRTSAGRAAIAAGSPPGFTPRSAEEEEEEKAADGEESRRATRRTSAVTKIATVRRNPRVGRLSESMYNRTKLLLLLSPPRGAFACDVPSDLRMSADVAGEYWSAAARTRLFPPRHASPGLRQPLAPRPRRLLISAAGRSKAAPRVVRRKVSPAHMRRLQKRPGGIHRTNLYRRGRRGGRQLSQDELTSRLLQSPQLAAGNAAGWPLLSACLSPLPLAREDREWIWANGDEIKEGLGLLMAEGGDWWETAGEGSGFRDGEEGEEEGEGEEGEWEYGDDDEYEEGEGEEEGESEGEEEWGSEEEWRDERRGELAVKSGADSKGDGSAVRRDPVAGRAGGAVTAAGGAATGAARDSAAGSSTGERSQRTPGVSDSISSRGLGFLVGKDAGAGEVGGEEDIHVADEDSFNPASKLEELLYLSYMHRWVPRVITTLDMHRDQPDKSRFLKVAGSRLAFLGGEMVLGVTGGATGGMGGFVLELALAEMLLQCYPREPVASLRERARELGNKRRFPLLLCALTAALSLLMLLSPPSVLPPGTSGIPKGESQGAGQQAPLPAAAHPGGAGPPGVPRRSAHARPHQPEATRRQVSGLVTLGFKARAGFIRVQVGSLLLTQAGLDRLVFPGALLMRAPTNLRQMAAKSVFTSLIASAYLTPGMPEVYRLLFEVFGLDPDHLKMRPKIVPAPPLPFTFILPPLPRCMPEVYRLLFEVFGLDPDHPEMQPKIERVRDEDFMHADLDGDPLTWRDVACYQVCV
ncbi:unnamed protein product [Closterium sp. Naga37s-1]|nr:unnamed protein product [Closterium sp. Naga37s-1]